MQRSINNVKQYKRKESEKQNKCALIQPFLKSVGINDGNNNFHLFIQKTYNLNHEGNAGVILLAA